MTKRDEHLRTVRVLSEALPLIRRYDGATVVIKLGGHAMSSDAAMQSFARDILLMRQCNLNPIIVHGGGPMINELLARLQITSEFVRGKRVTDQATVEVVEMVLSGQVNKRITQAICAQGGRAVGISGKDANLMLCQIEDPELGLVGRPDRLDPSVLRTLTREGFIPVIAPLGFGPNGETLNVNGDSAAGAIAGALQADRLLLLTDVAGVKDEAGVLLSELTASDVRQLTEQGVISGGMIPKTQTALDAVEAGVRAAVIVDGRVANACLLELFTEHGAGTMIRKDLRVNG